MKVEPGDILKLFLNFSNFEPQYSYRLYSYKKKSVSVNPYFSVVLQVQNMMYGFWSEITLSIAGCVIPFFCKCPVSAHTILSANLEYRLHPGYCQQRPCPLLPFCMHSKHYLQARTCRHVPAGGTGAMPPKWKTLHGFVPPLESLNWRFI